MLAKGTEDQNRICAVCNSAVQTEDRIVCVTIEDNPAIIHRDCHDTYVSNKNKY